MEYKSLEIQIDNALNEIAALDLSLESAYETILEIIDKKIPIRPIPQLVINPEKILYRSRCHKKEELEYNELSQLSYIKDQSKIEDFGRANRPGQSVFYCGDSWDAAVFEAGKISRLEDSSSIFEETHTVTKWITKKELKFLVFLDSENSKDKNAIANSHVENLDLILNANYDLEISKIANKLIRFISDEFSKNTKGDSNQYKISCAFAEKWLKEGIDGIIYPSFQRCFERLNYAIKPNVVDNCLEFVGASIEYIEKNKDSTYDKVGSRLLIKNNSDLLSWGEIIYSRKPFDQIRKF